MPMAPAAWTLSPLVSNRLLAAGTLAAVLAGVSLQLAGAGAAASTLLALTAGAVLLPLLWGVLRSLLAGDVGVDAIAIVAIVGSLALGEFLAGAVVALMLAGGNALEDAARRRATRELTSLVARAPTLARRRRGNTVDVVPVGAIEIGDRIVVLPGDVLPVDGLVVDGFAVVDESSLTGEPLPATIGPGEPVRSGTVNAGGAFELTAVRPAAESAYAALVRLVRLAESERAPFVRLADRYAAFFLPATALVAAAAWAGSGDPVRALAVFVVATPCPLILAAPVALVSGISRAARAGVVVKGGGALEALGGTRSVLLDKTGTVTVGRPRVETVTALNGRTEAEVLRLAASVEQLSGHSVAGAIVQEALARELQLSFPTDVVEDAGRGLVGTVEGHRVAVGGTGWLRELGYAETPPGQIHVGVDGRLAGRIGVGDELRPDASGLVRSLRAAGVRHVALATGDRSEAAELVGRQLGVDRVYAEQTPAGKVELVRALRDRPELRGVAMIGDGINDAPALAAADVGIAVATAGATISSETADAVLVVDRIERVADAIRIARRSLAIARQSVLVGLGLSLAAMGFAALGYLQPVQGALLQEAIDVAVILNALRALRGS